MRLLHVVPSYLPAVRYGGPIYSVHGLCLALARSGNEVHVVTTNVDGKGASDVPLGAPVDLEGVKVWYYPSKWLRRMYFTTEMGRKLLSAIPEFDVVHLHAVFLWPMLAAARIAERTGVPYVVSPRGMLVKSLIAKKSPLVKSAWIRLFEQKTLEHAAAVHLTSAVEAQDLAEFGFKLPRTCIIPNGIDVPEAATQRMDDGVTVLFLGRINWKKGLDRLITALSYVPGANLVIAGNDEEGHRSTLVALIERHGLQPRVSFVGYVEGGQKQALLRKAAVLVVPSYSENFGNVVLEAMAQGCPVIVTPEVGLADAVHLSGAGVVSPGEPERLGEAIRSLLEDGDRRRRCGLAGVELVKRKYSWDMVAHAMEAEYATILAGRNRSRA